MNNITSHNLQETNEIAGRWLEEISKKYLDSEKATIIGLSGHLGAGKTAFVKEVAKHLDIKSAITSPTFVIMKIYEIGDNSLFKKWKSLIHIDLYRLEKKEELKALNLDKVVSDRNNLLMIEWPENVGFDTDEVINFRALEKEGEIEISG